MKIIIFFLFFVTSFNNFLYSKEVNLKALEISTLEKGDIIIGEKDVEAKIDNEVEIFADKITYNKTNNQIDAEGNVEVKDLINKTKINSKKIIYYKDKNQFTSFGKTLFEINNKLKGRSSDVFFYVDKKMILSDKSSTLNDNLNNILNVSSFKFSNSTEILKANNIELLDNKKNKYFIDKGFIKLKENILIGKDIKINLRNDTFGIKDNDPKLKGNSIIHENEKNPS